MAKSKYPKEDLEYFKRDLIKIARQLCYRNEILEMITKAESEGEALRAMMKGRGEMRD